MDVYLLVSLFPAPQAGPVVIPKTQEVVIRHEPLYGVPDHVYVDGLPLHSKPEIIYIRDCTHAAGLYYKPTIKLTYKHPEFADSRVQHHFC